MGVGCTAEPSLTSNPTRTIATNLIRPPHLLSLPPAYPADLPAHTANTFVLVQCTVTEQGAVTACVSRTPSANPIAREAAFRWLDDPNTRFKPAMQDGRPVSAVHQMRIRFSDDPKMTPSRISYVGEWPHPGPEFPALYAEANKTGVVTYHFTVGPDGLPADVHIDSVTGGDGFAHSVLMWLRSGCVHFRPQFRDGNPVATLFPAQHLKFEIGR